MNLLVTFVQVFASLLAIISSIGFFEIPEVLKEYGIEATQLQITFVISLIISILSFIFGHKIRQPDVGRDKKTQVQVGGKKNKQNMK